MLVMGRTKCLPPTRPMYLNGSLISTIGQAKNEADRPKIRL